MGRWVSIFQSPRAKKIGKWVERAVLGSILLVLIIFQAPWKITLLLAWGLSSKFITFPKVAQKWEMRIFRIGLICLIIWMFIPSKQDGYRPFQFTEEIAATENQRSIPPEQDAYPIYDKLFHCPDANDRALPEWAKADVETFTKQVWTLADNPKLSEWVDQRQNILAELNTVLQYEQCRFPLSQRLFNSDWEKEQNNILKLWSRMLVLRANRYAGQGNISHAIEDCRLLSGLSKHQFQQLDLIQYLIGLALHAMTCSETVLLTMQPETSEAYLAEMDRLLSSMVLPQQDHWRSIMDWEKLRIKNKFCGKVYEINDRGRVRFSRASLGKMVEAEKFPKLLRPIGVKFFLVYAWFLLPESPYRFVKCIDEHYDKCMQEGSPATEPEIFPTHFSSFRLNHSYFIGFFIDIVAPAYEKIHDIGLRCQARWQASKIVIGLRRYKDQSGQWPESLSELQGKIPPPDLLIDPTNGGEFVYRREGDSFRFYSKGKNGIDDGGLRDKKTKTDDYLYWPIEPSPDSGSKTEKPLHLDANPS